MQKYIPHFGWAGIIFGTFAAVTAWPLLPAGALVLSILFMFIGFLFSSLYVRLAATHEIKTKINPGYVGMILSSAPVIMFIVFPFLH
jgi:hypothetical protein